MGREARALVRAAAQIKAAEPHIEALRRELHGTKFAEDARAITRRINILQKEITRNADKAGNNHTKAGA